MKEAKKILMIIGVISAVLVWFGLAAKSDYTWSQLIIEKELKNGWVVGSTQANLIDITHPWTIFKQPIIGIAFVKPSEFVLIGDGYIFAKTLWVNYEYMYRTKKNTFQEVYDCKNKRTAFVESSVSVNQIDLAKLDWKDNTNTANVDISTVVCK